MSTTLSSTRWTGIFPAITTKFHADESIDAEGTMRHIDFQIRNGIHGLVTCGSLGEASTLSLEEKLTVAKIALEAADGRIPVLANVSETRTTEALRYIAELAGAKVEYQKFAIVIRGPGGASTASTTPDQSGSPAPATPK